MLTTTDEDLTSLYQSIAHAASQSLLEMASAQILDQLIGRTRPENNAVLRVELVVRSLNLSETLS